MVVIDVERVIRDTQELIRIDSQNPGPQEGECAQWVVGRITEMGLDPVIQRVAPGRSNVIASVAGIGSAPRLVLLAHMDTVPVGEGWSDDPFGGRIVDGKLYGRGSCDMKAGLAVALNVLDWARSSSHRLAGDIVVIATVDEEDSEMAGARHLVDSGFMRPDDQVLALEPTGMRLRIAQMGLRWLKVRVHGRMAHAGRAHLGVDANHVLARIVDRLKERVGSLPDEDEILGRARLTCGVFTGGVATNVVPPVAEAQLDVRFPPPLVAADILRLVEESAAAVVEDFPGASWEVELLGADRPPNRASLDSPIVQGLRASYRSCTGEEVGLGGADGHEAYTDASMVAALTGSASCTVFGPGSTDHAHTADEFVPVADVELCCRMLSRMIDEW